MNTQANSSTDPIDSTDKVALIEFCQGIIGYQFTDTGKLLRALTHSSSATHKLQSNERMEFLGDSILGLCVCEYLFNQFTTLLEGELTKIKSVVVSGNTCARISRRIGLDQCLIVGKGMSKKRPPQSILADVFESIIAAIYLDGGLEPARDFVIQQLAPEFEQVVKNQFETNYKSQLQHITQRDMQIAPTYQLMEDVGPDHSKQFNVRVKLGETTFSPAWGKSKKEAEQRAACNALAEIDNKPPIHVSPPDEPDDL